MLWPRGAGKGCSLLRSRPLTHLFQGLADLACNGRIWIDLQSTLQVFSRVCYVLLLLINHSNMVVVRGIVRSFLQGFLQ
jgi:hypothetical protein